MAGAVLVAALAFAAPAAAAAATYDVGAATRDITPTGVVNLGGFGLGDGTLVPDAIVGRGGQGEAVDERIAARAIVFSQKKTAIAIADIETQGMFAAYEDGPYGLSDIAQTVEQKTKGKLPADHVLVASDHTHGRRHSRTAQFGQCLRLAHTQRSDVHRKKQRRLRFDGFGPGRAEHQLQTGVEKARVQ